MTADLSRAVAAVETKAQLLAMLAEDPALATPRLARDLWKRVIELYRSDARAAREVAECAWLIANRVGDQTSRAFAHRALALAALASGRQRDVLRHYESAERLYHDLGDEVERARVLRSMIDPLMHLGRYDEALSTGEEAGRVLRERGESVLAAQVDVNVANVHHRLGRDAESLDAYGRALRSFRAAGDLDGAAVVEFNRANVLAGRGELTEAERAYRRAMLHYRARGERLRESQCLYQLAYLAFLAGRYSDALRGFDVVRAADAELGDERHAALTSLDEAELLLSINAWEEARERAREAGAELTRLGLEQDATLAGLYLGLGALHLRRWSEAEEGLARARARFSQDGSEVLAALATLYQAELALRRGHAGSALRDARAALRAFEARGLAAKEAYARIVAGRALATLGRRSAAVRQAVRALERLPSSSGSDVAWRAHALLADLAIDPEQRRGYLETALAEADRIRTQIVPDELQASFQRDKVELHSALALSLLSSEADPTAAFEVLEGARSRVLADRLSEEAGRPIREGIGAGRSSVTQLRSAVEALNHLYRRLNEVERDDDSRAAAETIRAEITRREGELGVIHRSEQLERGSPTVAEPHGDTLPTLRRLLASDEAVVSYSFLRNELHAFVIDHSGIRWTGPVAERREVEAAVDRWLFQAGKTALGGAYLSAHADALRSAATRALGRLHELVWDPVEPLLDDPTTIVVIPSGALFYVPFHALWKHGRHLVERYTVSTAPSARVLIALHEAGAREFKWRHPALILGYEVEGLPGIGQEVTAVSARLPGAVALVGPAATRAALRRQGGSAPIVHLAAHAEFRGDNPLLSSIVLADGRLTFYDVFDLRLNAELVVLSGCQTGQSRIMEGDELMGLARGFHYAGARTLVSSMWPVEDSTAAEFMGRFYQRIAGGQPPGEAIAAAMRESVSGGRLPQEWAPFTLSGLASGNASSG